MRAASEDGELPLRVYEEVYECNLHLLLRLQPENRWMQWRIDRDDSARPLKAPADMAGTSFIASTDFVEKP